MVNLEITMPDDLYERLRLVVGADAGDGALINFALAVIGREVEWLEWKEHWVKLPVSGDTVGAAAALEEARAEIGKEAGKKPRELTMTEWQERRKNRPVLHINFDAAAAIRAERQRRESVKG